MDPLYQDIRLEVGESTTFQSGKVDWKCGLCKQVEVTMLNLQHTFNGFEYSYTMQISGKQYQGKMKKNWFMITVVGETLTGFGIFLEFF